MDFLLSIASTYKNSFDYTFKLLRCFIFFKKRYKCFYNLETKKF